MGHWRRGSATEYVDHVNYEVVISRGLWVRARSGRYMHCTTLSRNYLSGYAREGRKPSCNWSNSVLFRIV